MKIHMKSGITLILCMIILVESLPKEITVGGLFGEDEDERIQNAFKHAIYWINHKQNYLSDSNLEFDLRILPNQDLFKATKEVCAQLRGSHIQESQPRGSPAAIFGPKSTDLASFADSACSYLHIPHLEFHEEDSFKPAASFSINLHPNPSELAKAYLDMINYFNMEHIFIIYDTKGALRKMQYVLRQYSKEIGKTVNLRQVTTDQTIRDSLSEAKRKQWTNIIADLDAKQTSTLLEMALQQGMINPYHHFILTTLDLDTLDLNDYKYNHVNITGFRLVDPANELVKSVADDMYWYQMNTRLPVLSKENHNIIPYESALLFDAVLLFTKAIGELDKRHTLHPINVSCEREEPWKSGLNLYTYLNTVRVHGLTGNLALQNGRRLLFSLDTVQLRSSGLKKIGTWTLEKGLNMSTTQPYILLGNKTLTVITNLEPPYVMYKENAERNKLTGNKMYEGFCVDLLKEVARHIGFDYKIHIVEDRKYGGYDPEGKQWDGIIKALIEKKADMSVAALTINYEREQYVDFSKPFLNLGISILFKMPKKEKPGLFSFLNPLAMEIWLYLLAAYLTVSLFIFVLARFSPYEWYQPSSCSPDAKMPLENTFNLSNSFWFAIGTLMQQGSDVNPRACSTRLVGSTWWFFTLIIISSYTANLAAFLTIERMISPIESVEDLAKQTDIKYGTRRSGTTMAFFRNSPFEIYQRMWNFMEMNEDVVMTETGEEGIERVKQGGYAFFMESTGIDYITKQDCNLMQVGGLLDSKGFGMATPIGSPLRDKLSMAILHFQEEGKIQELYDKWWKGSGNCDLENSNPNPKANPLGVYNVGGIFVVLMGGLALSVIVAIIEFVVKSRKNAKEDKESLCTEMAKELRFALRCRGSSKKQNKRQQIEISTNRNDRYSRHPVKCCYDEPIESHKNHMNGGLQLREMRRSPVGRKEIDSRYRGYLPVNYSDGDST